MTEHAKLADVFERFAIQQAAGKSPLYETLSRTVARTPELLDLAADTQPGQPAPNMLLGAIHHIIRRGSQHPLATYFTGLEELPEARAGALLTDFCRRHAERIRQTISTRSVQTNEVGRCAVLLPAFAALQQQLDDSHPIRIVDVGASAGLNLLWDRYTYDYGGHRLSLPASDPDTELFCEIKGGTPPLSLDVARFVRPVGIELHPVDITDHEATEWLVSLTWPEQTTRMHTLNRALTLAARTPPTILAGRAEDHLADVVTETPPDRHLVFVFSWSIYQIFGSPGGRERLVDTLAGLSQHRPLHEISIGHFGHNTPRMIMASHNGGMSRSDVVAHCDVYGTWLHWLAKPSGRAPGGRENP
ncbi:DUF2332 domain-containing protein [Streptomyces griseocarneus]|uniref:DUF2332 domain-containing protein n=1 Tax=Streptomyces griseocarneus TaxID=51201 RepID=UPI00167E247E|nr:DUF2332 domain-containing protein [Streptomyces griseocarneus]MBZ6476700.1 DUF2332 domain-containing protein [Streptomyces griseocarneus]GHG80418.1 hypothetical protein GCM10018779_61960 [Streptomyces griseocarneus]